MRDSTTSGARDRAASATFGWYQPIANSLPPAATRGDAVRYAQAIEVGLLAQERLGQLDHTHSPDSLVGDLRLLVGEGGRAATQLYLGNLRLVFRWSKGSAATVGAHAAEDAFQAGCVGLGEAILRWDHRRAGAFSTYASWYIRKQIWLWRQAERAAPGEWPLVMTSMLEMQTAPWTDTVLTGGPTAQLPFRLDDLQIEEPSLAWDGGLDRVAECRASVEDAELVLSRVTGRQAEVLRRRHGLGPAATPMTLDAIGRVLGVTRERVRQIERDALETLRSGADSPRSDRATVDVDVNVDKAASTREAVGDHSRRRVIR